MLPLPFQPPKDWKPGHAPVVAPAAKTWAVPLLELLAVSYAGEDREGNNEMEFVARWCVKGRGRVWSGRCGAVQRGRAEGRGR